MTITLPLQPQDEARLLALAEAKGIPAESLVQKAVERVLSEETEAMFGQLSEKPVDARPIWEVIVDNMKDVPSDVMATMPSDGASQHDHYVYGWPKREV